MSNEFDPYHRWLGIRPEEQPADHYRLLGIVRLEDDPEVIRDASERQIRHVRSYELGEQGALAQEILNELARAKACLLNAEKKDAYDEQLREQMPSASRERIDGADDEQSGVDDSVADVILTEPESDAAAGAKVIADSGPAPLTETVSPRAAASRTREKSGRPMSSVDSGTTGGESNPGPNFDAAQGSATSTRRKRRRPTSTRLWYLVGGGGALLLALILIVALAQNSSENGTSGNEAKGVETPSGAVVETLPPSDPAELLTSRGLVKSDDRWFLKEEATLISQLRMAQDLYRSLGDARRTLSSQDRWQLKLLKRQVADDEAKIKVTYEEWAEKGKRLKSHVDALKRFEVEVKQRRENIVSLESKVNDVDSTISTTREEIGKILERMEGTIDLLDTNYRVLKDEPKVLAAIDHLGGSLETKKTLDSAKTRLAHMRKGLAPLFAVAPFDVRQAKQHQSEWAKHLQQPEEITNSIGMKLVLIPPGDFLMGSPEDEEERRNDEKQHRVRITGPFWLGVHEVTQDEYHRVVGSNPSYFSSGGKGKDKIRGEDTRRFPVEQVSWADATEFCRRLSTMAEERRKGFTYRLPTEAEWEYACRAGTTTPFHFGSQLNGREANCEGTYPYGTSQKGPYLKRTTTVGSYAANVFGLYDVHGNVSEWCGDWYHEDYYGVSPLEDPQGPEGPSLRVFRGTRVYRGGCWEVIARDCRAAQRFTPRFRHTPSYRRGHGFRVALVPSGQ